MKGTKMIKQKLCKFCKKKLSPPKYMGRKQIFCSQKCNSRYHYLKNKRRLAPKRRAVALKYYYEIARSDKRMIQTRRDRFKEWYKHNKESHAEYMRKYYIKNRKKLLAYGRNYKAKKEEKK